jgi:hypothetical protein
LERDYCDAKKKMRERSILKIIVGTYRDAWFGDVNVSVKNGKLWFDSKRSPKLTGEMFTYKGNSFVVKWRDRSMDADAFVIFSLDMEGKGSAISMRPNFSINRFQL